MIQALAPQDSLGQRICRRAQSLQDERAYWDSFWQDLGNYCSPRKAEIIDVDHYPDTDRYDQLYDTTAIMANQVLASGQMSLLTPPHEMWLSYEAPDQVAHRPGVQRWYDQVTEITLRILTQSNFYDCMHEMYLDRGAFGTACIACEESTSGKPLLFKTYSVGSFSISEDEEGYVDTVFREFRMTLRQMVRRFGEEALPQDKREALRSNDPGLIDRQHDIIHAVYPREPGERNMESPFAWDMPFASVFVDKRTKIVLQESGFQELPFAVTRFLRWRDHKYGWAPSWMALPEARQLNLLEKNLDASVDIQVNPRLLVPSHMAGEVNLRPLGVTVYDSNRPDAVPREWALQSNYQIGKDRAEYRRQQINKAFHVDLFQMFATTLADNKNMTATEVYERTAEKLYMFSSTYTRMTNELFNPLLTRVFLVLGRGGHYPPPPSGVWVETPQGFEIPDPKPVLNSRLALAIRSLRNGGLLRTMDAFLPMAELAPDSWDNLDTDIAFREYARNAGIDPNWLREVDERDAMREQRQEAIAAQQQAEMAETYAKAARNASGAEPDKLQQLLSS